MLLPRGSRPRLVAYGVTLVIASFCLIIFVDEDRSARLQAHRCYYVGGENCPKVVDDPFASLEYKEEAGHIFFPAHRAIADDLPASEHGHHHHHEDHSPPPPQPHPIHYLIREAEEKWNDKLARQSRTLKAAVKEYKRRYNRPPPKGFDNWFRFAHERGVQLLDEYDMINERILPYASVPPEVLKARSEKLQHDESFWLNGMTFTMEVRDHEIEAVGPMKDHMGRAKALVDLMMGFGRFLPDMNMSITPHDGPMVIVSGEAKIRHVEAAKAGNFLSQEELFDFADNGAFEGWPVLCPPDSRLRKAASWDDRAEVPVPVQTSFIEDHVLSMDFCEHPERQAIHGVSAWSGPRPALLFPIFTQTITPFHSDLLLPALEQWDRPVGPDTEWGNKKHDKVVWRGSTTGSDLGQAHMRKYSQRPRLCRLHKSNELIQVPIAPNDEDDDLGLTETYSEKASKLAAEYFDFKFQGKPQQCGDEQSCAEFEAEFEWDTFMSTEEQNQYKYVIDVDGNGWSGRFHRLMSSNALVLKSTVYQEWYSDRIAAWVHYVPIATDYQDLWSVMAFFKGDLHGRGAHDEIAEKMATQGKKWSEEFWRWEDMQAYLFRLLLEYARVMNYDPNYPLATDLDESRIH